MKFNTLTTYVKRTAMKAKHKTIKHAPEITITLGIAGVIVSSVIACKRTMELPDILEKGKKDVEEIREKYQDTSDEREERKEITIAYAKTGGSIARLYAFPVVLGAASIFCIGASHGMMKKRNAGLAAYAASLDSEFKKYRERVIEKYGEEAEKELRYGMKTETVTTVDEDGNETTEEQKVSTIKPEDLGDFTRFYQAGCIGWTKDPEHNKLYLRQMESIANNKLRTEGHVWLNDVLEMLGYPKTKLGHVVGWLYDESDPKLHNCIDFGIHKDDPASMRFVNGYENVILLDFNVDGNIYDMM